MSHCNLPNSQRHYQWMAYSVRLQPDLALRIIVMERRNYNYAFLWNPKNVQFSVFLLIELPICITLPFLFQTGEPVIVKKAYVLFNVGGTINGSLELNQDQPTSPVRISGTLTGLPKGQHGFHVHASGDIRGGCGSTGGHFNPNKVNLEYFRNFHGNVLQKELVELYFVFAIYAIPTIFRMSCVTKEWHWDKTHFTWATFIKDPLHRVKC